MAFVNITNHNILMTSPMIQRIKMLPKDNPMAWKLFTCFLSFIWITFFLGVVISQIMGTLPLIKLFWIAVILSIFVCILFFIILRQNSALLYYRIWVPMYQWSIITHKHTPIRWFCQAIGLSKHDKWLDLIVDSQKWNRNAIIQREGIHNGDIFQPCKVKSAPPLVIRREHIEKHLWSQEHAFTIVLLFNQIQLLFENKKQVLDVDLRHQSCAIYNNRGKQFILSKFLPKNTAKYLSLSHDSHKFLLGKTTRERFPIQITALRWASGGFLPVAKWRGKKWVCLFFRDISPVGWNLANGASETKEEYKRLNKVIYREMIEELIIYNGDCKKYSQLGHRLFNIPGLEINQPELFVPNFVKLHNRLREEHDGIIFKPERGPDLQEKPTSQNVRVHFHSKGTDSEPEVTRNVIISINPLELGVEIIRIGEFELRHDDCLLDGEIHTSAAGKYLVRRPIILLSVEFLRERYKKLNGSLGPKTSSDTNDDRKSLEDVPREAYHFFIDDISLRQARLKLLEKTNFSNSKEANRLRDWNDRAKPIFESVTKNGRNSNLTGNLAILLPVVWKTIEIAFEQRVL